jgi:hypothetical protein
MAVGATSLADPRYLRAVLEIAVRGLPHAFRAVHAGTGASVTIDVPAAPTTTVTLRDDLAWKLLFNALPEAEATAALRIEGKPELAEPLLRARSVIV